MTGKELVAELRKLSKKDLHRQVIARWGWDGEPVEPYIVELVDDHYGSKVIALSDCTIVVGNQVRAKRRE